MAYLSKRLPEELVQSLSYVMMPDLVPRIKTAWLDSAVPASLQEIDKFEEVIGAVRVFCNALKELNYSGFDELQEWVASAPKVWLTKCKETALDTVRIKLAQGLGDPREVERVETQKVSRTEGQELAANGAPATADDDDWGAAWDEGGGAGEVEPARPGPAEDAAPITSEEDGADAWGWGEGDAAEEMPEETVAAAAPTTTEDDGGDAWGWDDGETTAEHVQQPGRVTKPPVQSGQTREMTLKETYNISSMPEPVLALISAILEDGASLVGYVGPSLFDVAATANESRSEGNPVAAAASGLFSLPTLVLAMFRAISPSYYALDVSGGGNMYLYNDATYLAERLTDLAASWKARDDIAPRAVTMLRLENDIKTLQSFAARAYASEMSTQRTVLRDLLGGIQNLLQQDVDDSDISPQIEAATTRVRAMAATWSGILSRSAWCQAVGSLADTLASKLVADVMDLAGIGQDEAYNIANLIAIITELDDLFLQPGEDVPATSQYADQWLRLKYLSEVLQSNLPSVKYLWMESDLSLYFTVEEVVDLIGLSFVDNVRTREVVREIRENPQPKA
jgi:centromere/kinetochore protein ZW10